MKTILEKAHAARAKLPLKEPYVAAFERAEAKASAEVAALANGTRDLPDVAKIVDKLWDRYNNPEIRGREDAPIYMRRIDALHAAMIAAAEKGRQARLASLHAEGRRLRDEHRASQPLPGSYEHEVAMLRGGR